MSSWMELYCEVECPRCQETQTEAVEFNNDEGDRVGVDSRVLGFYCTSCDKKFYCRCRVNFDVEMINSYYFYYKKKPKDPE